MSAARTASACMASAMADLAITGWQLGNMAERHAEHTRRIDAANDRIETYFASLSPERRAVLRETK